jgi:hypothetical protein
MVKVRRTYETVIYPYRTTGPGNGRDAGGMQPIGDIDSGGDKRSTCFHEQIRPLFPSQFGNTTQAGHGFRPALFFR